MLRVRDAVGLGHLDVVGDLAVVDRIGLVGGVLGIRRVLGLVGVRFLSSVGLRTRRASQGDMY
jgi:hypothetical protein